MYSMILNNISKFTTLTPDEQSFFISMLDYKFIPKKTILQHEGDICQFEGYITRGCARIFYVNEEGCEVTLAFATEDCWISDVCSFYEKTPSIFSIETLEDTEMYVFTLEIKEKLFAKIPKLERSFRLLVQRNLSVVQNRLIKTITHSATDRYLEFIQTYPSVPRRIPQYYIASFLGVSPAFISTIRKRLSSRKKIMLWNTLILNAMHGITQFVQLESRL